MKKKCLEVISFLKRAASKNHTGALLALGKLYEQGNQFLAANPPLAYDYYKKCVDLHNEKKDASQHSEEAQEAQRRFKSLEQSEKVRIDKEFKKHKAKRLAMGLWTMPTEKETGIELGGVSYARALSRV